MIDDVGISAVRIWIWSTRNMPRKECRFRLYRCMFAQKTKYKQHNSYALSSHTLGARISLEKREDRQERNLQGNCGNREVYCENMDPVDNNHHAEC